MKKDTKKNVSKFTLFFALFTLLPLSSCKQAPEKEYTPEEIVESIDDALHAIDTEVVEVPEEEMEWASYDGLTEVPDREAGSTLFYLDDIKCKYAPNELTLLDQRYLDLPAPEKNTSEIYPGPSDLHLYDENGTDFELTTIQSESGYGRVAFPIENMWRGHLYHLDLMNENVCFKGKDPSIRSLLVLFDEYGELNPLTDEHGETPTEWDEDGLERIDDLTIKNFDPETIYYYDKDSIGLYFVSSDPIQNLSNNELFRIGDNEVDEEGEWVDDDEETFYGRFVSCAKNPNGAGYLVRYTPADATDIYKQAYVEGTQSVDMEEAIIVANQEELKEFVVTSEPLRQAMYGVYEYYDVAPANYRVNALDWFSHLRVSFSTKSEKTSFTFKVTVTLTFNPTDHIQIKLESSFESTTKYDVSASAKIKYKWNIIPTGAEFNLLIKEDNFKKFKFGIVISSAVNPFDKEAATNEITKNIDQANEKGFPWKSMFDKNGASGSKTLTKDGAKWALFQIDINYFPPFTIRFNISFYFEALITFEAFFEYSSHTQKVDVSYSNKESNAMDAASSAEAVETEAIYIAFVGKMSLEGGLVASIGVGFFGLYKYLHAEVSIKGGGRIELVGYLTIIWSWTSEQPESELSTALGGKLELSLVLSVTIDVFLIVGGYNHTWPIGKVVLFAMANMDSILKWATDRDPNDPIRVESGTAINSLGLLEFKVFNGDEFVTRTLSLKYDYKVKWMYGAFVPTDKTITAFTFTFANNYLLLQDGKFQANAGHTPYMEEGEKYFEEDMIIHVDEDIGDAEQRTYRLHYYLNESETIPVSLTKKEGLRKEDATLVTSTVKLFRNSSFKFMPQARPPLGLRLVSYTYILKYSELIVSGETVYAADFNKDADGNFTGETVAILNQNSLKSVDITFNYADVDTHPIYWLGFNGDIVGTMELNHGSTLNTLTQQEINDFTDQAIAMAPEEYSFENWMINIRGVNETLAEAIAYQEVVDQAIVIRGVYNRKSASEISSSSSSE